MSSFYLLLVSRYSNRENLYVGHKFDNINNDNERVGFEILEGSKSIMTHDYIKNQEKYMLLDVME